MALVVEWTTEANEMLDEILELRRLWGEGQRTPAALGLPLWRVWWNCPPDHGEYSEISTAPTGSTQCPRCKHWMTWVRNEPL